MSKSVLPGEGTPLLSAEGAAGDVTSVYMRRWYIVLVFSIGSFIQALGWNTWGPITESAEAVFGWHDSQIGMFANGGNIAFMICVLPFCYFMDVKGIRVSLLMCAVVVFIGTGIRCITMETTAMTWLANAGAVLLGIGGSVPFAGPAKLSSVWFPPDQRATATSIVSFANYFGVAMSFIFGPLMVSSPKFECKNSTHHINGTLEFPALEVPRPMINISNTSCETVCVNRDDLISEIRHLMYLHTAIAALFLLLVIVYFPDKPPTPPSKTASMERTEWLKGLRMLTKNSAFWLVVLAGAVSAGVLGVWASVLDVNLNKHGISQSQAGYMGFWQTLAGCSSGLVIARFSDMFMRRMKLFLLLLFIGAALSSFWFTAICEQYIPFNIPSLYTSCILIGIFINGGIPLFYEVSCEASYPVAEGVTGGVMTLVNNLFGVLFLCIMLIKDIGTSWMNWALFGSAVAALPLLILFPERYRRTDLDITIDIKPTSGDLQASDTTDDGAA
ncbi:solute carrier family 49 member 4 homolog [Mya arenaria]|uniref:solute carrier family 49 member 4 homolog n=1 Tax=Mya arenaria TaxID=6604 RepID=UPI0022E38D38|nr:solute carrier family 49 member 4 homolog [Mya arenaria]